MLKNKKGPGRPPVVKSIKDFLSAPATKKLFEEGKDQVNDGGGYPTFDDGKYRAQIVSASVGQSKTQQRWQHVMGFKFIDGEYKGQTKYQFQGLENTVGFTVIVQTFSKLGIEIESAEDLESADKQVIRSKPIVDIRLQTKGEFQNVLVLKAVDEEDAEETEDAEEKPEPEEDEDADKEVEEDEDAGDAEDADEEEEEKPKKKSKKVVEKDEDEDEADSDEDEEDEDEKEEEPENDKVNIVVGTKVKIEYDDEEVIGKVVRLDETEGANRIKVKLKSGEKVWVKVPDEVVDVIAG